MGDRTVVEDTGGEWLLKIANKQFAQNLEIKFDIVETVLAAAV